MSRSLACWTLVLVLAAPSPAGATYITQLDPTVSYDAGSGANLYQYVLSNLSTQGEVAFDLQIAVDSAANLFDVQAPAGWAFSYAPGDTLVDWLANDFGTALPPGGSLAFSFRSALSPGDAAYTVLGDASGAFVESDGTTVSAVGPASVPTPAAPEPSSGVLAGTGFLVLLGYWRRARRAAG
jgi:hypothetical protein